MKRSSKQVEVVETHNLLLSLNRIHNARGFGGSRWKRALYHALGMFGQIGFTELQEIRKILRLP